MPLMHFCLKSKVCMHIDADDFYLDSTNSPRLPFLSSLSWILICITLDPDLLRQGNPKGQQVPLPTSLTDNVFKAWLQERTLTNQATYLDLVKQELASDTVEQLKTIAVKWGATISLVSKGSKRALLQFITVLYMYGK